jgi:hypothetical protein
LESIFDDDEFDERVFRFVAEGGGVIFVVQLRDKGKGEFSKERIRHAELMANISISRSWLINRRHIPNIHIPTNDVLMYM